MIIQKESPGTLENYSRFEISLIVRNAKGEPVYDKYGAVKRQELTTDSAYTLWKFFMRNSSISYDSKKRDRAATASEAAKILKTMQSATKQKEANV